MSQAENQSPRSPKKLSKLPTIQKSSVQLSPENASKNKGSNIISPDNASNPLDNKTNPLDQAKLDENASSISPQLSTLYPRAKWVNLQSILERGGRAVKPTTFSLEVYGIYSIPEIWSKLEQSGAVDTWPIQVIVGEAKETNGKFNLRELTEDEKNALDNKKKAPPKIDKKNPDAVREEEERLAKIKAEKEAKEKEFMDELEKLEPMDRFYKIKEMPTTGDYVTFNHEENKETANVELKDDKLLFMEDCINDKKSILIEVLKIPPPDENEKKRPKPKNMNPEDIKPISMVGISDLNEFYIVPGTKEIILRTPLLLKETYERRKENKTNIVIPFDPLSMDLNPFHAVNTGGSEKKTQPKVEENKQEEEANNSGKAIQGDGLQTNTALLASLPEGEELDFVEKAHTYIYYKLSFSNPINPRLKTEKEKAEPSELIKSKDEPVVNIGNISEVKEEEISPKQEEENQPVLKLQPKEVEQEKPLPEKIVNAKPIAADEMCYDLRKYLKIFINTICSNFDESSGDSNKNQAGKRENHSSIGNVKRDERDKAIGQYQQKFLSEVKAQVIKDKLKRILTQIALEKFKKRTNFNEKFEDCKDRFFSELYAYICDEIRLAMDEFVLMKRDDINDNILSSYDQSRNDLKAYVIRQLNEPEEKRLLRLSKEYEIIDELDKAMIYYKSRLTIIKNKESWINFAILAKKTGSMVEVEEAISNCLQPINSPTSTNPVNTSKSNAYDAQPTNMYKQRPINTEGIADDEFSLTIIYSAIKYLKGRIKDALGILLKLLNKYSLKGTNYHFNCFLAFLFKEKGDNVNFMKHYEAAKRFKMLELGINLKKPKLNPKEKNDYKPPTLDNDPCDDMWYSLITLFNEYFFFEISEKLLDFINNKTTIAFLLQQAGIAMYKKEADKAIEICDSIINQNPTNYKAWIIRGHAFHLKNNLFDSEESYIQGIKNKPDHIKFDIKMLTRLGIIYIRRKTWNDAKTVFLQLLQDSENHSFAWRYLGFALTRLKEFKAAEEALNEAVLHDLENPLSWAYMTLFCIVTDKKREAIECLNEVLKMNFRDVELISEIAYLLFQNGENQIAADLYKRILNIDGTNVDSAMKLAEIYKRKMPWKKNEGLIILEKCMKNCSDEKTKKFLEDAITMYKKELNDIIDMI